jgi:hypothetical protein
MTFLFLHTNIKDKVSSSFVPVDFTPVSSPHDVLLFAGRAVGFSSKDGKLNANVKLGPGAWGDDTYHRFVRFHVM